MTNKPTLRFFKRGFESKYAGGTYWHWELMRPCGSPLESFGGFETEELCRSNFKKLAQVFSDEFQALEVK